MLETEFQMENIQVRRLNVYELKWVKAPPKFDILNYSGALLMPLKNSCTIERKTKPGICDAAILDQGRSRVWRSHSPDWSPVARQP